MTFRLGLLLESDGPGGAEQVVADLAEEFAWSGAEVRVLVPRNGEGWLRQRLQHTPAAVVDIAMGGPLSPAGIASLVDALRRHPVDLLHTHEFGQALPGAIAARICGTHHLLTMHGGRYYAERWRRRAALRTAITLGHGVTAVSGELAARIERDLGFRSGRVRHLPNGARPAPGSANGIRATLGIPKNAPLLLAIGNLYPVKGHQDLMHAVAVLAAVRPDLHVAIAGRGAAREGLESLARSTGLEARIHFLGLRSDVGALLNAADLFVHPSHSEGLPLAVLEAMFAGRPIIASAVGDIPVALAQGSAGVLVPPADPAALAAAIDDLLRTPVRAQALGTRAMARAEAEYGVGRMVDRYRELYAVTLGRELRA